MLLSYLKTCHCESGYDNFATVYVSHANKNNVKREILECFEYMKSNNMIEESFYFMLQFVDYELVKGNIKGMLNYGIKLKNLCALDNVIGLVEHFREGWMIDLLEDNILECKWLEDYKQQIIRELKEELI